MDEKIVNDLKPGHLFVFGLVIQPLGSQTSLALGWKVSGTNRSQQKVIEMKALSFLNG